MTNYTLSLKDRARAELELRKRVKLRDAPLLQPQTDDELHAAVKYYVGIDIPQVKVCDMHVAPFTAFADAYFARSIVSVWKASRGLGGKSLLLAALTFFEALSLGAYVTLLGGSAEQAKRVHDYQTGDENIPNTFWDCDNVSREMLETDPTRYRTKLTNGGLISVLTASSKSVRGPHPVRLRCDEVDEIDQVIMDAALGQPMEARGIESHTVLSSTHQYPDGTMTEMLRRAESGSWPVYEWCYKESQQPHGWLSDREIQRKRELVTAAMWSVEFDLQEPSSENRAIDSAKVKLMFDKSLGTYEPRNGEVLIFEHPESYAQYAIGTDWAKKQDRTITYALRTDCIPMRLVAFRWANRTPWPSMVSAHDIMIKEYSGAGRMVRSAHDGTGIGDVVADYMTSDSMPVIMSGRTRSDMLTNYIAAIEAGNIRAPMIKLAYSEHLYATQDDLYGSGHLPDTMAAGTLAYLAYTNSAPSVAGMELDEPLEVESDRWEGVRVYE